MTTPELMSCPHNSDGWCLGCVGKMNRELLIAKGHIAAFVSEIAVLETENKELQSQIDNDYWPHA